MKWIFPKVMAVLCLIALFQVSCSTSRIVKPLEAKEVAVGFDFGGPIINLGSLKIPIPRTSVTGAYGVNDKMTAFGALHTTDLAYGTIHLEGGVLRDILPAKGRIPGISVAPSGHFMLGTRQGKFRFYPQIDLNAHWTYKDKNFLYFSFTNWFDFGRNAHGAQNTDVYIPTFALGHTFVNKHWRYTLEVKHLAAFTPNRDLIVSYNGIGGRGSLGVFVGLMYRFNGN